MRDQIKLTDEEIFEPFTDLGHCVDSVDDLVFTRETVQDFIDANKNYAEAGHVFQEEDNVWWIKDFQHKRGEQRKSLVVVDFGEIRAVYVD